MTTIHIMPLFSSAASALLAAGQLFLQPAPVLGGVAAAAQGAVVLDPLPVRLLLGLPSLGLRPPSLLPLPGLRLGFGLPLLGAALSLQGLVAGEGAVGLLGLALSLVHLPPFLLVGT